MMRFAQPPAAAIALMLAGCAGIAERQDAAAAAVRGDVAVRATVPAAGPAIAAVLAELREREVTEDDAVRIALLNNGAVRVAMARLGVETAALVQAGLLRNPVFDARALLFLDGGSELDLGIAQPFVDLFQRPLRERMAGHEFAAAEAQITRMLVQVAFEVRREFARIRAAQQLVAVNQRALQAAAAAHDLMRQLFAAGNVAAPLLAGERVGAAQARLDLEAAERAAREAREPLNRLLGLWGQDVMWRIGGELPASALAGMDLDNTESRAVAQSLELRENRARIDAAAQGTGLVSWRALQPDGSVGVAAMRDEDGDWAIGPSLELELPVFDQGQARLAAAAARLRVHLEQHARIAVDVRAAARQLRDRLEHLDVRVRFLEGELVPAQRQLLTETLRDYNAMQIGVFEVLAQKRRVLGAERELVTTVRDAWFARIDLEQLLAGSMPEQSTATYWPAAEAAAADPEQGDH